MTVERKNNEIIFRLPGDLDIEELQRFYDYFRFKELTKDSVATEKQGNNLAAESKAEWWKENKSKFLK